MGESREPGSISNRLQDGTRPAFETARSPRVRTASLRSLAADLEAGSTVDAGIR